MDLDDLVKKKEEEKLSAKWALGFHDRGLGHGDFAIIKEGSNDLIFGPLDRSIAEHVIDAHNKKALGGSTHVFKTISASWGIMVALTARKTVSLDGQKTLCLDPSVQLNENERSCLMLGWEYIKSRIPDGTAICIEEINFSSCDYQHEGLTCALVGWAAKEFKFQEPEMPVSYNKVANHYTFDFGAIQNK